MKNRVHELAEKGATREELSSLSFEELVEYGLLMQRLANKDAMTELPNRAFFEAQAPRHLQRSEREESQDAVLMVDVDHFKEVNDTLGHDAGDEVLRTIARVLLEQLRPTDFVGRWGGEEFIVLLPEVDCDEGRDLAERIRKAVGENVRAGENRVTVSIGLAHTSECGHKFDLLRNVADGRLYQAKKKGRNHVVAA